MEAKAKTMMNREGDIGKDMRIIKKDDWRENDNYRYKVNKQLIEENNKVNHIKNENKSEIKYRENLVLINNRNSGFVYRNININSSRASENKVDSKLDIRLKENLLDKQLVNEVGKKEKRIKKK